jgi:hypothetical protein
MPTVLRGSTLTLELVVEPVTPEGPVPTMADVLVDIINPSDVEVVTDAAATEDADPPEAGTARWTYDFEAAEDALLGDWTVHWTATVNGEALSSDETFTVAEVEVQAVYFTEAEARAFRSGKLANETKYPTADIEAAREEIEQFIEKIIGYACVPRTKTVTLNGDGSAELFLPDTRVTAVSVITDTDSSGTVDTYDPTALADVVLTEYGSIRRRSLGYFTFGWGNIAITYTHGLPECPGPIKRAALILLHNRLIGSDVSDRAQSFTNESGTLAYSTPNGMAKPTGLPEVDAILYKYSDHAVHIA